jgi:outer membrane lipoprotein LolB
MNLGQVKNIKNFYATGKVAFSDGKKGGTASIEWQQLDHNYSVVLIGALGSGTLAIQGNGDQVTLTTSEGQYYTANTPEQLIEQHLGWIMPISSLQYWLKGVDAPGPAPTRMEWDQQNRLAVLEQQGWTIQYVSYAEVSGIHMPTKLQLDRGPIRLRFIFRQWRF